MTIIIIYHLENALMSEREEFACKTDAVERLVELSRSASVRFLIYKHDCFEIKGSIKLLSNKRDRILSLYKPSHSMLKYFKREIMKEKLYA